MESPEPLQTSAGSSKRQPANGLDGKGAGASASQPHSATLAAIGISAYIFTDLVYLAFSSAACVLAGCELVEIASSAVRKLPPPLEANEPFLVHTGGSMGNLLMFLFAWAFVARKSALPATGQFFLWLVMTLNGLAAGGQIFISNAIDAGGWAMLTESWPYRILWKLLFTAVGLGIAVFVFSVSREGIEIFLGRDLDQRRRFMPKLSSIPYLAGSFVITSTAALSMNNKTESIIVAAVWTFGLTGWLLIFTAKPHLPRPGTPHRPLPIGRNAPWIVASAILAIAFGITLGPGIWLYS